MQKNNRRTSCPFPNIGNKARIFYVSLVINVLIITVVYYLYSLNHLKLDAKDGAIELSNSAASLIFIPHTIEDEETHLSNGTSPSLSPFEEALAQFVESTDTINYAFILKTIDGEVKIIADSSATVDDKCNDFLDNASELRTYAQRVFVNGRR